MPDSPFPVVDNETASQYELTIDGHVAFLRYIRMSGVIELQHTEVPEPIGGRGIASALAKHALDAARDSRVKVLATCPVVRAYLRKHAEYLPLLHH
jgi:predicted GNAT family acetyltransferase